MCRNGGTDPAQPRSCAAQCFATAMQAWQRSWLQGETNDGAVIVLSSPRNLSQIGRPRHPMKSKFLQRLLLPCLLGSTLTAFAGLNPNDPTWWDKYTYLAKNASAGDGSTTGSTSSGGNVDVSNECGPQSETFVALNTLNPKNLVAGSNEIIRLPMRGYYSTNSGKSWGAVDLP